MHNLIDYISQKIVNAELLNNPFKHFEINDLIPEKHYKSFICALPKITLYNPLAHRDAFKQGCATRFELSLSFENRHLEIDRIFSKNKTATDIVDAFCSERFKSLLLDKFESTLEVTPYPHLYKDLAGFHLPPHTDIVEKAITFGWYLPENALFKDSGLGLFTKTSCEFKEVKRIPYIPNKAFAFLRSSDSWHGVRHSPSTSYERNSLFVTFYRRNHYSNGSVLVSDPNLDRKEIKIYEQ